MIPRLEAWQAMTKEGFGQRRGANMTVIDTHLKAYWDTFDNPVGPPEQWFRAQAGALIGLLKVCNTWLKRKIDTPVKWAGLFGGRQSFVRRKTAVVGLGNDALSVLDWLISQNLTGPPDATLRDLKAREWYESHRLRLLTQGLSPFKRTKALDRDFARERDIWETTGKQSNVSGTVVYGTHHSFNPRNEYLQPPTRKIRKIMRKAMHLLSISDWLDIAAFARANFICVLDQTEEGSQCMYLRKDGGRMPQMVFRDGAGNAINYDGALLTTANQPGRNTVYAMDRYGNLFTAIGLPDSRMWVNHSTMLAGNEVTCAGCMTIDNGKITSLDNASGHYKPSRRHLMRCVDMLAADAFDLSRLRVILKEFAPDGSISSHIWNYWQDFLIPGSRPDQTTAGAH
jgi:hypothetical protein